MYACLCILCVVFCVDVRARKKSRLPSKCRKRAQLPHCTGGYEISVHTCNSMYYMWWTPSLALAREEGTQLPMAHLKPCILRVHKHDKHALWMRWCRCSSFLDAHNSHIRIDYAQRKKQRALHTRQPVCPYYIFYIHMPSVIRSIYNMITSAGIPAKANTQSTGSSTIQTRPAWPV